ncbi:F-box only protein 31-like [Ostrea edulis]|uniref:F-box only protein 31-like n=1 Tax=Ostrea edulis TaxID=37623 RepID=UPI0024AFB709|nr:F-box only protein 31-like [Ostrea edulis]
MTDLLSLPPELLTRILEEVPGKDLLNVCTSCKQLRDIVYVDSVWQRKCEEEYKFKSIDGWNMSYRDLYNKVLRQYGDIVGLWWRDFTYYGGLLQVKYDSGCIKGIELLAPVSPYVDRPLRRKTLFTISLSSSGGLKVVSVHNASCSERPCSVHMKDETKRKILEYEVEPETDESVNQNVNGGQDIVLWMEEELNLDGAMDMYYNCYFKRGIAYLSSRHHYRWTPLEIPKARIDVPIQAGLFKGTYSAHGIEILSLAYNDEKTEVTATKITGDPNIPATKVSVKADLTSPLVFTLDEQEHLRTLEEASQPHTEHPLPDSQPFKIPEDCYDRDIEDIPKTCSFRCNAKGQISATGYTNPSFSRGHFVVFDENRFGMVWIELHSFSIYARVEDKDINNET